MPKTVSEMLAEQRSDIEEQLRELLSRSSLYRWNLPGSSVFFSGGDYAWGELDAEAKHLQSKLLEEFNRFSTTLRVLLAGQPKGVLSEHDKQEATIRKAIQQDGTTWTKTIDGELRQVIEALEKQFAPITHLYDPSEGTRIYVPDTNALLFSPKLDQWRFADSPRFTMVLVPTVLGELDSLKVNHRVEDVRRKAEALIGQIKSYRSRGDLIHGVTLKKNLSTIMATAVEPRGEGTLPWLDLANKDDRIVASLIEVMRQRPRCPVALVTRDITCRISLRSQGCLLWSHRRSRHPAYSDLSPRSLLALGALPAS